MSRMIGIVMGVTVWLLSVAVQADVTLTWEAPTSANQQGYYVERAGEQTFSRLVMLPAGQRSYVDKGALSGVYYCYRIQAFNGAGLSPYSNTACAVGHTMLSRGVRSRHAH